MRDARGIEIELGDYVAWLSDLGYDPEVSINCVVALDRVSNRVRLEAFEHGIVVMSAGQVTVITRPEIAEPWRLKK